MSLSVNASCLTPPNPVSKPEPPCLNVTTWVLVPPSFNPTALLNTVFETIPEEKLFGAGFEDGLLVIVESLSVLPDWPLISISYNPLILSLERSPELKLLAFVENEPSTPSSKSASNPLSGPVLSSTEPFPARPILNCAFLNLETPIVP